MPGRLPSQWIFSHSFSILAHFKWSLVAFLVLIRFLNPSLCHTASSSDGPNPVSTALCSAQWSPNLTFRMAWCTSRLQTIGFSHLFPINLIWAAFKAGVKFQPTVCAGSHQLDVPSQRDDYPQNSSRTFCYCRSKPRSLPSLVFFFFFLIKDQWRHGIPDTQHLHKNRPEDRGSTARGHIGVYMHVILDKCMVYKHME